MIRTLLVDDDALTLELHRSYLERLGDFVVEAECSSARAAVSAVLARTSADPFDLMLLDITMPDGTGLDVLRTLRAHSATVDVIAITGVRDAETVRQMAALGVFQYLVKPFSFAMFAERLDAYRVHRAQAATTDGAATQAEIDALLTRVTGRIVLPKGLARETLDLVVAELRASGPLSASETAARLGMSRVSVRRYLEHLVVDGVITKAARYGTRGRPETEYAWARRPGS